MNEIKELIAFYEERGWNWLTVVKWDERHAKFLAKPLPGFKS